MKYLSIIILVLFMINTGQSQDPLKENMHISNDLIKVVFDASLTQENLDAIQEKMKELCITLNYKETKFKKNGKLKYISFEVDCNDGFSGGGSQQFILNQLHVGFYRDYRNNVSTFGAGSIGQKI